MTNTFLFRVTYWDEISGKESVMFHLLRASSFSEAVKELEEYHGDTLISLKVECFEDYYGQIPESVFDDVQAFYQDKN